MALTHAAEESTKVSELLIPRMTVCCRSEGHKRCCCQNGCLIIVDVLSTCRRVIGGRWK